LSTEGQHATAAFAQLIDVLGEAVVHWPAGVEANKETITAIVDRTEQTQGRQGSEANGNSRIPKFATLSMARSVEVTEGQDPLKASVFFFDSQRWYAVSIPCVEDGCQEVLVKRVELGYTGARR